MLLKEKFDFVLVLLSNMSNIQLISCTWGTPNIIFACKSLPYIEHYCSKYYTFMLNGMTYNMCEEHLPNGAWESVRMYHYIGNTYWSAEVFTADYFRRFANDYAEVIHAFTKYKI